MFLDLQTHQEEVSLVPVAPQVTELLLFIPVKWASYSSSPETIPLYSAVSSEGWSVMIIPLLPMATFPSHSVPRAACIDTDS